MAFEFMKNNFKLFILLVSVFLMAPLSGLFSQVQTIKPWTYWWWMGSAVNKTDIQEELHNFKNAGIGGVHIVPIYGVKGYEDQFKEFLSPEWVEVYKYTLDEAKKIGLGVDITTGTGWPFGGPNVTLEMAARKLEHRRNEFTDTPTLQKVKRAAPGGEGYVLNPFSKQDMGQYLGRFDSTITKFKSLRSFYYDSYEVYHANWTRDLLREFNNRRGYNLQSVSELFSDKNRGLNQDLVRIDYQETLSELLLESSEKWAQWCEKNGFKSRYQAHGAPGNILDLYAISSIPETESFGSSAFPIPDLRIDEDYPGKTNGRPDVLTMKFASSAANLSGKSLVSSETCTWLADHFKVSLSQVKPQVDELFTSGINHIFFHGTTYSPKMEQYPGWLFYASTNFGVTSHFHKEFPLLNKYITNCQRILQSAAPDNDVLVYFPIRDIWADVQSAKDGIHGLDVHSPENWLYPFPFGRIASEMKDEGFTFDFISDAFLEKIEVKNRKISISNRTYKALVVPFCSYMPGKTLNLILNLAQQGVVVIFDKDLPENSTGYSNYLLNSKIFEKNKEHLGKIKNCIITGNVSKELKNKGINNEMIAKQGLAFIRKREDKRRIYFVANLKDQFRDDWIELNSSEEGVYTFYDPLTEERKHLTTRKEKDKTYIYLRLLPGQSCFVFEDRKGITATEKIPVAEFKEFKINTSWNLQFLDGLPVYKAVYKLDSLQSWTSLSDTASFFSGRALYSGMVHIPDSLLIKKELILHLGDVRESANIKINNQFIGTVWSLPFEIRIPEKVLKPGENKLDIEVTNLSANYMRVFDKKHPEWKKFYNINFVNINGRPFNTNAWEPMPSGFNSDNLSIRYR